jgi:transposase InsO family protein
MPVLHSDQGWQYQMSDYRKRLAQHNITQSMSRKGNCLDNSAMENFFGRLKTEMFLGENFASVEDFIKKLEEYICYFNNERISLTLKGMSPVEYRTHSVIIQPSKFLGSHHPDNDPCHEARSQNIFTQSPFDYSLSL